MRVLIFGSNGMLGHKLLYYLGNQDVLDVTGTIRSNTFVFPPAFNDVNFKIIKFSCEDLNPIKRIIQDYDVIINAIGAIKQRKSTTKEEFLEINGLFPHRLAFISSSLNKRFIQISTDCVFSGTRGYYSEEDTPDPIDIYGLSKAIGEIRYGNNLTIRTSIVGTELKGNFGLLEWMRTNKAERVSGFKNALWSGVTTDWLSKIIAKIILEQPKLKGLYNIGLKDSIDKHSLLKIINRRFKLEKRVEEDFTVVINRSLNSEKFFSKTKIPRLSIEDQISFIIDLKKKF